MRKFVPYALLLTILTISCYVMVTAQEPNSTPSSEQSAKTQKLKIVPLVTLKPGETKELLLSTWCTVGSTRGGGFSLAEMRNGKPSGEGTKSYSEGGVTISVPTYQEGEEFAGSPEYAPLKKQNLDAFKVSIAASNDATPRLMEMHLVDTTCNGSCQTDFRVLVVGE